MCLIFIIPLLIMVWSSSLILPIVTLYSLKTENLGLCSKNKRKFFFFLATILLWYHPKIYDFTHTQESSMDQPMATSQKQPWHSLIGSIILPPLPIINTQLSDHSDVQSPSFLDLALSNVLASYCCCNKVAQTEWLKTTESYSHTVMESRSLKSRCQTSMVSLKALGDNTSLPRSCYLLWLLAILSVPWIVDASNLCLLSSHDCPPVYRSLCLIFL